MVLQAFWIWSWLYKIFLSVTITSKSCQWIMIIEIFKKKKNCSLHMYPNNILFNKKNVFSKILTKHICFRHNHFLEIILLFYQMHYFQQNAFFRMHSNRNTFSKKHSQSRGSKRNLKSVAQASSRYFNTRTWMKQILVLLKWLNFGKQEALPTFHSMLNKWLLCALPNWLEFFW